VVLSIWVLPTTDFNDFLIVLEFKNMGKKQIDIRKVLSQNIKKRRDLLGISQEKLAENAGISSNMVKDIEGCRSWVSDKTLIKLASALKTDIYRLLVPATVYEEEMHKNIHNDLLQILNKMRKDIDSDFEESLKLYGLK